jgi:hypothetical protein
VPAAQINSTEHRRLATSKVNFLFAVNFMACFFISSDMQTKQLFRKEGEIAEGRHRATSTEKQCSTKELINLGALLRLVKLAHFLCQALLFSLAHSNQLTIKVQQFLHAQA